MESSLLTPTCSSAVTAHIYEEKLNCNLQTVWLLPGQTRDSQQHLLLTPPSNSTSGNDHILLAYKPPIAPSHLLCSHKILVLQVCLVPVALSPLQSLLLPWWVTCLHHSLILSPNRTQQTSSTDISEPARILLPTIQNKTFSSFSILFTSFFLCSSFKS